MYMLSHSKSAPIIMDKFAEKSSEQHRRLPDKRLVDYGHGLERPPLSCHSSENLATLGYDRSIVATSLGPLEGAAVACVLVVYNNHSVAKLFLDSSCAADTQTPLLFARRSSLGNSYRIMEGSTRSSAQVGSIRKRFWSSSAFRQYDAFDQVVMKVKLKDTNGYKQMHVALFPSPNEQSVLVSNAPRWNKQVKVWILPALPSCRVTTRHNRNFQLVPWNEDGLEPITSSEDILLQFGMSAEVPDGNHWILHFRAPLSAVLAFGVTLSAFL